MTGSRVEDMKKLEDTVVKVGRVRFSAAAEAVHVWWMWDLLYPTTTNERREFNRQNNIPNQEVIE